MKNKILTMSVVLILICAYTQVVPDKEVSDPLITNKKLIEARKNLIIKLLQKNRYREAVDELLELRKEVPRRSSLFIDLWIGISYMNIADYIERGIMRVNDYGELEYREEIDIKYYTEKDKVIIKDLLKSRKDLFTADELNKMETYETPEAFGYEHNDIAAILNSAEVKKAEKEIAESGMTGMYVPWDEAETNEEEGTIEVKDTENVLSGTVSSPRENVKTNVAKKKIKKVVINKDALKYYELAIRHFNRIISASLNNPYRERAVIKKAETFFHMQEKELSVAEYNYFLKSFPESTRIVDVLIAKGNVLTDLKSYKHALHVFEEIIDTYPETDRRNYVLLKIRYLRMLLGMDKADGKVSKNEIMKKLKILEQFEEEIKKKEQRLQELEEFIK
ncbi:MAG TPA: hypothetical protein VKS21_05015 [Spirochaetota bacterium]|nr:hypothetical protein [Spirochaetota bacterium]